MTTTAPPDVTGTATGMATGTATVDPAAALAATAALVPFLAAQAEDADRAGRVSPDAVAALRAAGAHRMLQPRAFGGAEASVVDHVRVSATAAEGCVAAGWCTALWSVHNWMVAHFSPATQAAVWADPTALVSGSIVPRTPLPDDGPDHVRVAGRFGFASGCDHADWLLVGGRITRGATNTPAPAMVVVPRSEVTIDPDSWDVAGLRGSGSRDLVIDPPVRVARERAFFLEDSPRRCAPGQVFHGSARYHAPFLAVGILVLAPPALGAARAALARFVERLDAHVLRTGGTQRHDPAARLRVVESAADIDAAERTLIAAAQRCDELGARPDRDPLGEATVWRDAAYAVRLCAQAVDRLFEAAGGSALARTEPLQRLWRDVHAIRTHAVLTWDGAAGAYADALLGPAGAA